MFDFGKWLKDVFDNSGNAAGGGSKPAPAVTPKPGQRSKTPAFKQIKAAPQFTQPKLNIGGFDYTRRNDGTYLNPTGEVRTQDQLRRLQGINTDAANRQKKIDAEGVNPFNIAKDIVSAPVKVAGGIGKGAADMAVGQINDWGNRVADTGSAAAEVIREFSGQNQRDFDRQTKYANEYQDMARSFQQRAKNAQNPAERQRYTNQARSLWAASDDVMSTAQNDIDRGLQATDPMKTTSNAVMTALDLATLGKGKMILEGLNLGQKVTGQSLKTLGENTLVSGGQGAGIGFAYGGLSTMQDPNATPLDYARNMGMGALLGAGAGVGAQVALPVAGVAAKNTAAAANKVATDVGRDISPRFGADTHPAIAELDGQFKQLQAQFDSAPSVVAKRQAERAMRQNRVQRQADYTTIISQLKRDAVAAKRRSLQGGYLAGPGAKGYKSALERGEVFDGVDGKPRFEVDDSGAKLKSESLNPANKLTNLESQYGMMTQMKKMGVNNPDIDARLKAIPEEIRQAKLAAKSTKKLKLSDVLDHEDMYKQYPELRDVNVKVVNNRPFETKAAYDPRTNTVELNKKRLDTNPDDVKSNILHEVQHAIQEKEGFATGGYDKNMNTYRKLAGEAEARAVQKRMDMPMSERYKNGKTTFDDSLDVPKEDLIVRQNETPGVIKKGDSLNEVTYFNDSSSGRTSPALSMSRLDDTSETGNQSKNLGNSIADSGDNVKAVDDAYIRETVAQYNSPEQFRTDLIEQIWQANKEGKGVDSWLIPDEYGSSFSGRGAMSNNSMFYQDFYKEYGHKPTKREITELVDRELAGEPTILSKNMETSPFDADIHTQIKERSEGLERLAVSEASTKQTPRPTLQDALDGKDTRLPKKKPEATQEALIQQPQQKAPVSELGKTPELQGDRANSLATNVDRLQEQQLPVRQEAPQGTQQMPLSTTEPEFGKTGSLSSPYKPKITTKGTEKQVAVMQMTRDGDVVTSTNVNPKLKNKTEKKFAVNEDGELIPDRKGATSIIMDKDGRVSNVRIGKKVYGKEDFGDLSDVNDYGSALATMRRNVERGFGKETSEKMSRFLVDHQQAQATKMIERKLALMKGTKEASEYLGIGFRKNKRMAKKVSAAIQDFGEGVRDKASLVDEYGADMANKIETVDGWFRKQYDDLLDEANATLKEYGYDPIPKRKNYYTHFQDETLWKKFGLKMDEFKSMVGDPTLQDAMPDATRGSISNKLAGQSEFTQPGKRFNKFALQRKGDAHTSDAFGAFERYVEPTLNNIYMTPSISRARVISRAIAQDADVVGKDANKMLIQIKEWANDLAGKTNRFDRPIIDTKLGNKVVKTLQWTQKKAGQNTIVGNLSTAVMQPIVLAQTAGRFGYKNTVQGLLKQMTGKNSQEMAKSGFLKRRYSNETRVTATRMDKAREVANTPLELFEETATRSTWEAALYDAKGKGLKGDEAVRYADIATEKTVAGRAIGEKPEVFRSKAAGALTMYQLEVANYWQQMGKEMTKTQAAKTLIAAYGLNTLLEAATGRRVGFDPVDAAIDMYGETQKEEKDWVEKAKSIGQRGLGETADNLPFLGQGLTVAMGDKGYRDLMGPESQGGRFGVSSPISTLAQNPAYLLSPFGGSQAKKTYTGLEAFLNGRTTNKDGETTVDIPQTPENAVRGTLFGPSAIPEVSQYYNNLGKKKVDQKAVQNQKQSAAGNQSLDGLTKEQQTKLLEAPEYTRNALRGKYLAENETKRAEEKSGETKSDGLDIKNEGLKSVVDAKKKRSEDYRAGFSDDDYAIVQMSKTDQKKLVSEGIISAEKLEGLNNYDENLRKKLGYEDTSKSQYINQSISEKSKTVLNQYYEMDSDQREDWFNKGRSNEYKYWKAKYENDKAEGKVSKIEDIRYKKALAKDKVGSRYTKDVRDLYNLSKADLYSYLSKEKKGAKLSEELIRYDQDLYNKGLTRYLKFKTGIAPSRGGRSGGRGSRGGRKAKKFDYKLDGFLPKGDSTNKKLYDLLKQAKMRAGKA